jgi:hypothetical protein
MRRPAPNFESLKFRAGKGNLDFDLTTHFFIICHGCRSHDGRPVEGKQPVDSGAKDAQKSNQKRRCGREKKSGFLPHLVRRRPP